MNTPNETGLIIDGEVIRVIDGDTVEIEVKVRHRVRLLDCWAPETRTKNAAEKKRGIAARERLRSLLFDCKNRIRLFLPGHDRDLSKLTSISRVLGRLWRRMPGDGVEPRDLSSILVSEGHATAEKVRT